MMIKLKILLYNMEYTIWAIIYHQQSNLILLFVIFRSFNPPVVFFM